jgi:uncharacterized protein involved in outer membrane biogenesis
LGAATRPPQTMRKAIGIAAVVFGALVLIAAALVGYAFVNLSSIVTARRQQILARVSDALGRPVEVAQLRARAGWGVSVEVTGLRIADDPAFAQLPMLIAKRVSVQVALLPLLRGRVTVSTLDLIKPDIRIVRSADGRLNLSTLGPGQGRPARVPGGGSGGPRSSLAGLSIAALRIDDGALHYTDLAGQAAPIQIHHVDLALTNFSIVAPVGLDLKFAFAGERQNVALSGKVGPLSREGLLDVAAAPLDLKYGLRSLMLDHLRTLAIVGPKIPAQLSIPDPVSMSGTFNGTPEDVAFTGSTDLTADRIAYGGAFNKPAGIAMTLTAKGRYAAGALGIASAALKLADLELTAVSLGGKAPPAAQIDTNRFGLAAVAAMVPRAAAYGISGKGEFHGSVALAGGRPDLDATVALDNVALKPARPWPPAISDLNGSIRLIHQRVIIDPATFTLGAAHASLTARVESISPLSASYALKADSVKPAALFAGRPPDEVIDGLSVSGTALGELASPKIGARITSPGGRLANTAYRNLDLTVAYAPGRASAHPLRVDVFGGALTADLDAALAQTPRFDLALTMRSINVEQALRSQGLEAANTVHGLLSGNVTVSGSGARWAQIRPTLIGRGRVALANGKLVGVNIVANAINAVGRAPGVSQLVNAAFMSSHHGLLVDPDTELTAASMTFQLAGPRFTTHDLAARSPDYAITGDGWFDMDKKIDMAADITLSFGLQVALPVIVTGKLPAVLVLPDLPELTKRVAMTAIGIPGAVIQGGVSTLERGAGAVGGLVGGGSSKPPSIPNPLDTLKKLWP